MDIKWVGSPNFTAGGNKKKLVVIHIMAGTLAGTDSWFKNKTSQVSSHYGIGKKGDIHQYVAENDQAFANGRVNNPTSSLVKKIGGNPNSYCISIEHEGSDLSKQPEIELQASAELIKDICTRNGIPIDREHIIGHYEIYSLKPNCPATDKSVIDKIISMAKEEPMNTKFVKSVSNLVGKDYGDNLNESEQKDASERLDKINEIIETLTKENEVVKQEYAISLKKLKDCEATPAINTEEATVGALLKQLVKIIFTWGK